MAIGTFGVERAALAVLALEQRGDQGKRAFMLFPECHVRDHREFGTDRGFLELRADENGPLDGQQHPNKAFAFIKGLAEEIAHIAARREEDGIDSTYRHRLTQTVQPLLPFGIAD